MTITSRPAGPQGFTDTTTSERLALVRSAATIVAEHGIDACRAEVAQLAVLADNAGESQVLIDVMLDPTEPEVARTRAFGLLLGRVSQRAAASPTIPSALADRAESTNRHDAPAAQVVPAQRAAEPVNS